ncbi:hypothetical protein E2C01_051920 [Portunus trituberculatus]|uniref:Uncharacterized protein n=1 Tax=Portunus trituberculatus TaxID=210409 RepID=A0A5B7GLQ6_PORTR|nr:hypothetical protein [Portunus trituberculatus]
MQRVNTSILVAINGDDMLVFPAWCCRVRLIIPTRKVLRATPNPPTLLLPPSYSPEDGWCGGGLAEKNTRSQVS